MVRQYRKKSVCIEAVQFTRNNWDEVVSFTGGTAHTLTIDRRINGVATCIIPTSVPIEFVEGQHIVTENDFIIKGVHGEFYPCKPDIFEKTYELVGDA